MAYDSRSDQPKGGVHADRHNFKRESLFVGYSEFNPTYRSVHQAPAPDFDGEPEFRTVTPKGLPPYSTTSPGYAVVVQFPDAMALASPHGRRLSKTPLPQQRRKATAGRYR